ncbi:helix-turn-helix domain-containing protein [Kribbella sp. NPDC051718]|uniref:TetR/AcrR family transcriptional regulator n=1 Tax=Kribbella sp. NPDC051718 TaxID=3155168 RepID=UPI00341AA754
MAVKGNPGHRERQALATKAQVAAAARRLFAEQGYVATTITAISAAAEIPAQTIYSAFGNKAAILGEISRTWMRDAETRRLSDDALTAEDPIDRLRQTAHWHRRQFEAGYDVIVIYQEAARADPAMAEEMRRVWAAREHELTKYLAAFEGELKVTADRALDILLACTVPEAYRTLVVERGWSLDEYEVWLGDALIAQLL